MSESEDEYEKAKQIIKLTIVGLIDIYFDGINRDILNLEQMIIECPNFIKDAYPLVIYKMLNKAKE